MSFAEKWKQWKRRVRRFADRPAGRRRSGQRPALFLEPLEDRTLLTAWTALGPAPILSGQIAGDGPVSGRITGIAADPQNANIVYIAAAAGGIWESTNASAASPTWTPLTDNLTDSKGNPLPEFMGSVAETDAASGTYSGNRIVYGGMGEANNSGDSFYGDGILVSTNGGTTWTLTNAGGNLTGTTVGKIIVDPSDTTGGTAYAAVSDNGANGNSGNTGIWKTTDFGKTWTNMTGAAGLSQTDSWSDVAIDPHTHTLFAAEGNSSGASGNGVYESTDGGKTWTLLSSLPNGKQDGRIALALYDDGTTNELFASIANPSTGELFKLEKSTDGGKTFTDLTNNSGLSNYMSDQGWYDTTLAVDPSNANYLYVGGAMSNQGPTFSGEPLESFDGGATWQDIATDSKGNGPHTDDHAVAFDANGNLLDGNDGGIWRLNNPANSVTQTWSDLNSNLQITQFYGVAADPTVSNVVYGGSQDNGEVKYTGALGWSLIYGGDGGITRVDPLNPNIVYEEYVDGNLNISTDGGTTFAPITDGIASNTVNFIAPYVLDGSGNIYYGTDYLNFSSNHGSTWSQIGTPGTNNFNGTDAPIDAVAVKSSANSTVVYVSAGGHLYVTNNAQAGGNNVTWTQIDLPGGLVVGGRNSLVIDPSDPTGGTAYAVVNSFTSGGQHVYKTTNFGKTWTDISGNLPNTPTWSVAVNPDGKTVYAGTDVGLYYTIDGGTSWAPFGTGLPNAQVMEVDVVTSQNLLLVGTHGRGAWEIANIQAPVVTTNPANRTVDVGQTATFTAAANSVLTLSVQWQVSTDDGKTWTNVANATSTTLTLTNVQASQNGYEYRAVFTNSIGSTTTTAATLTVLYAPSVTINPIGQSWSAGQTATFTAAAAGSPAPTVQWQVSTDDGNTFTNIAGATFTTLTLTNVQILQNGYEYQAIFKNSLGSVTTNAATLTVAAANVKAAAGPVSAYYRLGTQTVALSAKITDTSVAGVAVDTGIVTFTLTDSSGNIVKDSNGNSNVLGKVSGGTASANFNLAAGQTPGSYTIAVSYSDATNNFLDDGTQDTTGTLTLAPANVAVAANSPSLSYSSNPPTVTLSAKVSDTSNSNDTVNEGTVTFTISNGAAPIVSTPPITVANGFASTNFTLPAGLLPNTYTISVRYSDSLGNFTDTGTQDTTGTLTITQAHVVTTAANVSAAYSFEAQKVTLSATVVDTDNSGVTVNAGTVTFTIKDSKGNIIKDSSGNNVVLSGNVTSGTASASFSLSPGQIPGASYTIFVSYSDSAGNFTDDGTQDTNGKLTITPASVHATANPFSAVFSPNAQSLPYLTASVANDSFPSDIVNEGTVTFAISNGSTPIGSANGTVANGTAQAAFSWPAGRAAGSYTIGVSYNDSLGNFADNGTKDQTSTLTVSAANTTTTVTTSPAVFFRPNQQTVSLSAAVADTHNSNDTVNEGTVTFTVLDSNGNIVKDSNGDSSLQATVSGGAASAQFSLPAGQSLGNYTIAASYADSNNVNGVVNFNPSASTAATSGSLTVTPAKVAATVNPVSAFYSPNTQTVTLNAKVADTSNSNDIVNEGAVTFTVTDSKGNIIKDSNGNSVVLQNNAVTNGAASAQFTLAAGQALGNYTIAVSYTDSTGNFADDGTQDQNGMLTVTPANVTTTASSVSTAYSLSTQTVTLSAKVADTSISTDTVGEGAVTFTVLDSNGNIIQDKSGNTFVQGSVSGGAASAQFSLPAGQALGNYTIAVSYSDSSGNFTDAGDTNALLGIAPAKVTIAANSVSAFYSPNTQTLQLSASVANDSFPNDPNNIVNEGTVTFTIANGQTVFGRVPGSVSNGTASANFNLPAGQALGTYTITVSYSDSTGNFTDDGTQDKGALLTVAAANVTITAANIQTVYNLNPQTATLRAAIADTSIPSDTVNEGSITFTIESGLTVLGSVQSAVSGGAANAGFPLPAGLAAGNYVVVVSYSDSTDHFAGASNNSSLSIGTAATSIQLVQTSLSPNDTNLTVTETVTAHVSSATAVDRGTVTFTLSNQTVTANVDGNGNAAAVVNVPMLSLLSPQTIGASYADPANNLTASSTTQTASWQTFNLLFPSTATFASTSQSVTVDLDGLLLTFTNGAITEIDLGSIHLVFSYNTSGQLAQVNFDGMNLLP